jgi:hypothetical protein
MALGVEQPQVIYLVTVPVATPEQVMHVPPLLQRQRLLRSLHDTRLEPTDIAPHLLPGDGMTVRPAGISMRIFNPPVIAQSGVRSEADRPR